MFLRVGTRNEQTREVWLERQLRGIPSASRILDAGAGEQKYRRFCQHLHYVSQDFGRYDGKGNRRGLQMGTWDRSGLDLICDIASIPEPDASFDAVMCIEVFEHLPDPLLALREFSRLLRPGGHLLLTAPFCSLTHFAPYHFYTGFNRYYYETHLQRYGFEILDLQPNGNFFEFLAQELRRIKHVSDSYVGVGFGLLGRLIASPVLMLLSCYSRLDKGSHELLNFGFMVTARKKS